MSVKLWSEQIGRVILARPFLLSSAIRVFCVMLPYLHPVGLQSPGLGEGAEAAVVSFFGTGGEAAAGKLLARQVIAYTLTAHSLSLTAGICTAAIF